MIEICTVGGYNEVGKNMTAVKVDDEVVILDMGLYLEKYIKYTEDEDIINITGIDLIKVGAAPNINKIKDWWGKVKAIIPTHAHLDHIGAIPFLASNFNAPIIGTPFTIEVLKLILKNEKINLKNRLKVLGSGMKLKLSKNIEIEFINITHSTPQTVMIAVHTKYGILIYANDFKFDKYPVIGKKPNFKRLEQLGKKGVIGLIVDSTYASSAKKTPSESVAREMLRDVLLGTDSRKRAIIVTTFSSHLARLKSIIEFGKKLNRKIIFMGRSLGRYTEAGENVGLIKFSKKVEIVKYSKKIKKKLRNISKDIHKYLLVVTGHQGEPNATLSKMVDQDLGYKLQPEDHIVFSCITIPTPTNIANRTALEEKLRSFGVRIFKEIHVSGHAAREDLRDLINLVKPTHIIPAHGELKMTSALSDLASEMGYDLGKNVHIMMDGQKLKIKH